MTPHSNEVAIVGIACALPSGVHSSANLDHQNLWHFLERGLDAYEEIPKDRFDIDSWHGPHAGQIKTRKGTFLKESTMFDPVEFGISSRDALAMSPATRKLVELSFLALLDSGIDYRGRKVGCFMAGTNPGLVDRDEFDTQGSFAEIPSMIANRVSYALDLVGPSIALDTACSSTMSAVHLAIQSILNGDCEAAIVGGCQYNHTTYEWVEYSVGGVLAPDGKCKPFDASGDGFARGEGSAVIVLKRAQDADRDKDHVYAKILGTAINSSGSVAAPYVPVGAAQQECIREAFKRAGRQPTDVDFVELHATGTAIGDPIESNYAGEIFQREDPVLIGSIKGNLGHLEITACLASLIKVCLIFENAIIPPTANLVQRNPAISWDKYRLAAPTEAVSFRPRSSTGAALACVSSSGIGGANGHLVLESVSSTETPGMPQIAEEDRVFVILAGGLTPRTVTAAAVTLENQLHADPTSAYNTALMWARRARQMTWRTFAIFEKGHDLSFAQPSLTTRQRPPIIFVLSGQGPQYIDMGRQFYRTCVRFRESIQEMDRIYEGVTGTSLIKEYGLFAGNDAPRQRLPDVWPISVTLPSLAIFQMAMIDMLRSAGVYADAVLGHSAGETALLYACGAASKAAVIELAVGRALAMATIESNGGTMAALACHPDTVLDMIATLGTHDGVLEVACHNSPQASAVSGSSTAIDRLLVMASDRGIWARRLRTNIPVHCSMMEGCRNVYEKAMQDVFSRHCTGPITTTAFSTSDGHEVPDGLFNADYFWQNARNPVLFTETLQSVQKKYPHAVYVEVSPHPVLSSYISDTCGKDARVLCPAKRPQKKTPAAELRSLMETLGQLSITGVNDIDLQGLFGCRMEASPPLPYPFNPRHVPFHAETQAFYSRHRPRLGPLNAAVLHIGTGTHPDLAEHVVQGMPIVPATGFIEMALEFGAYQLWDVCFHLALPMQDERPVPVQISLNETKWTVKSSSVGHKHDGFDQTYDRLHAEGHLSLQAVTGQPVLDIEDAKARCSSVDIQELTSYLSRSFSFGKAFSRVEELYLGNKEAIAVVRGYSEEEIAGLKYRLHPAILDGCLQGAMAFLKGAHTMDFYYLPAGVGYVSISDLSNLEPYPSAVVSHMQFVTWEAESAIVDIDVYYTDGRWLCSMESFVLRRHRRELTAPLKRRFELISQPICIPIPSREEPEPKLGPLDPAARALYKALDKLAQTYTIKTLQQSHPIGEDVSRRRYHQFMQVAAARDLTLDPSYDEMELRKRWPAMFELADRIGAVQSQILTSSEAAVNALFADDIMTQLYTELPETVRFCQVMSEYLRNELKVLVDSGKRVIRVMEVGTGTGTLTRFLLPILEEYPDVTIEYIITDIAVHMVSSLAEQLSYEFVRPRAYDVSKPPTNQGIPMASIDIITGFQVVHAAPLLKEALAGLNQLLVPGGTLMLIELDGGSWSKCPGTLWFDFIFGSFREWFGFEDTYLRPSHCALAPSSWPAVMEAANFIFSGSTTDSEPGIAFALHGRKAWLAPIPSDADIDIARYPSSTDLRLFYYTFGREQELQHVLTELSSEVSKVIWLIAVEGKDGDALQGLFRTVAIEYPVFDVKLAIFSRALPSSQYADLLERNHSLLDHEKELYFDAGGFPHVFRLAFAAAPSMQHPFDPEKPWLVEDEDVVHTGVPIAKDDELLVTTFAWSAMHGGMRAFCGTLPQASGDTVDVTDIVVGVTTQPMAKHVAVPARDIASVQAISDDFQKLADLTLPAWVAHATTSRFSMDIGSTSKTRKVLLLTKESLFDVTVAKTLGVLGWTVMSSTDLETGKGARLRASRKRVDLVVGTSEALSELRTSPLYSMSSSHFPWNDPERGILARQSGLRTFDRDFQSTLRDLSLEYTPAEDLTPFPLPKKGMPVQDLSPLFDHQKAYVLIGGIGGLGLKVAAWMYENGARHIVLTSRSGEASVARLNEVLISRTLDYLRDLQDLDLRLEACDALSGDSLASLYNSIKQPLAGCMMLPLVLSDGMFASLTREDFDIVYNTKVETLRIVTGLIDVESLDFFITFSSISGLLGNGGQANYALACTTMDAIAATYRKGFTLIVPAITDVGYVARASMTNVKSVEHMLKWGITSTELCDCIGDGIRRLADGPFTYQIPDLPWPLIEEAWGDSLLYEHLVYRKQSGASDAPTAEDVTLADFVRNFLKVAADDFSEDVPLTHYGLDSLSAAKLSSGLRNFGSISQLQLLGDLSLNDIQRLWEKQDRQEESRALQEPLEHEFSTRPIVQLRQEDGVPLIVLHGSDGSLAPMRLLKEKFNGSLWAVQVTRETPLESLERLGDFYFDEIKALRPTGPYRLAGFSGSSVLLVYLCKRFEASGDRVAQLVFLDHFPMLLYALVADPAKIFTPEGALTLDASQTAIETTAEIFARDGEEDERMQLLAVHLKNSLEGKKVPDYVQKLERTTVAMWATMAKFITQVSTGSASDCDVKRYEEWLKGIKAPVSVYWATRGVRANLTERFADFDKALNARRIYPEASVHEIPATHSGIMATGELAASLQNEWSKAN